MVRARAAGTVGAVTLETEFFLVSAPLRFNPVGAERLQLSARRLSARLAGAHPVTRPPSLATPQRRSFSAVTSAQPLPMLT